MDRKGDKLFRGPEHIDLNFCQASPVLKPVVWAITVWVQWFLNGWSEEPWCSPWLFKRPSARTCEVTFQCVRSHEWLPNWNPSDWPCWLGFMGIVVHVHLKEPRLGPTDLSQSTSGGSSPIKSHAQDIHLRILILKCQHLKRGSSTYWSMQCSTAEQLISPKFSQGWLSSLKKTCCLLVSMYSSRRNTGHPHVGYLPGRTTCTNGSQPFWVCAFLPNVNTFQSSHLMLYPANVEGRVLHRPFLPFSPHHSSPFTTLASNAAGSLWWKESCDVGKGQQLLLPWS